MILGVADGVLRPREGNAQADSLYENTSLEELVEGDLSSMQLHIVVGQNQTPNFWH